VAARPLLGEVLGAEAVAVLDAVERRERVVQRAPERGVARIGARDVRAPSLPVDGNDIRIGIGGQRPQRITRRDQRDAIANDGDK
jgi:hypothetical protein